MTVTTTVTISHEEMHDLHLTDKSFKDVGYTLRQTTTVGKIYEKVSWNTPIFEVQKHDY